MGVNPTQERRDQRMTGDRGTGDRMGSSARARALASLDRTRQRMAQAEAVDRTAPSIPYTVEPGAQTVLPEQPGQARGVTMPNRYVPPPLSPDLHRSAREQQEHERTRRRSRRGSTTPREPHVIQLEPIEIYGTAPRSTTPEEPPVVEQVPETSASQAPPQTATPEVRPQSTEDYQRRLYELESRLGDLRQGIQRGTTDRTGDPEREHVRTLTDPTYRPPMPDRSRSDALQRILPRTDVQSPITSSGNIDSQDRSTEEHRGTESEQAIYSEEGVVEPIIYDPELRMYGTAAEIEARYREIEADIRHRREERERHFQSLRQKAPSEFLRLAEQLTSDERRAARGYLRDQQLLADDSLSDRERRDLTYRADFLARRTFTPRVHELVTWWEILEYGPEEAERRSRARARAIDIERRHGSVDMDFDARTLARMAGLEAATNGIFGAVGAGVGSTIQDLQGGRFDAGDQTAEYLAERGSEVDSLLEGVAPIVEGLARRRELRRIPDRELNALPTLPPESPTLVLPQESTRSSGTPEQRGTRERLGGRAGRRTPERTTRRHTSHGSARRRTTTSARPRTRSRRREISRARSREEHGRLPEIQNPQEIPLRIGTGPRPQVQQLRGVRYGDLPPRILTGDTARTGGIRRVAAGEIIDEGRAVFVVIEGRVFPRPEHGFGRLMEFNEDSRLRQPSSLTVEGTSLSSYEHSHLWGPRWGDEARDGIMLAPRRLNQIFQNHGVETTIDRIATLASDLGGTAHVVARARSFPRDRMRGLRGREFLLREVEYEVSVDIPGITNGRESIFRASIEVDHPSAGGRVHDAEVTRMGSYYSLLSH